MSNFESLASLVWPGELPRLRDSYTVIYGWPKMTKNMTQDDLKHAYYHFYRFPETKLVLKHVPCVKNYDFKNWPLLTWPWPGLCSLSQKFVTYASLSNIVDFCMQNGPKNMYHMVKLGYKNMVTFGDLTLTWPGHVNSPKVSKDLDMFARRPSVKYEAHSLLCLVFVAQRIQNHPFDLWPRFDLTFDLKLKFLCIHQNVLVESFRMACSPSRSDD